MTYGHFNDEDDRQSRIKIFPWPCIINYKSNFIYRQVQHEKLFIQSYHVQNSLLLTISISPRFRISDTLVRVRISSETSFLTLMVQLSSIFSKIFLSQ